MIVKKLANRFITNFKGNIIDDGDNEIAPHPVKDDNHRSLDPANGA